MKNTEAAAQYGKKIVTALGKYKFVLLIIFVGVVLLAWPSADKQDGKQESTASAVSGEEDFSVDALERKLEKALSEIEGAGQVTVVLTAKGGTERVLAKDASTADEDGARQEETSTVVVSTGSGSQEAVLIQQLYPRFQGALVVTTGGGDPSIRLKIMEAISALTGLGSDKISICKGK